MFCLLWLFVLLIDFKYLVSAAPNTKDLDVYIKRNHESGFGFRVLGGEGPDQPVGSCCDQKCAAKLMNI